MASEREMGVFGGSNPSSDSSSGSEMELGARRLGEMELDAARALADMAKVERDIGEAEGRGSRRKRTKLEARYCGGECLNELGISRSQPTYLVDDDAQDNKATDAEADAQIKAKQNSELSISNVSCSDVHVSCFGRRMKQNMTEAEKEARRIRRVLANRESARQTIRRRQAVREELIKKVADLSLENENMKMEKELVTKQYISLKDRNKELKVRMAKAMKAEVELRAEIITRDVEPSTSPSTELSLVAPSRSSGQALASRPSVSLHAARCNEEGGSSRAGASRTLIYVPLYAWLYPLFHHTSESYPPCCQASGDNGGDFIDNRHGFIHCPHMRDNLGRAFVHVEGKIDVSSVNMTSMEGKKISGINLEELPKEFNEHEDVVLCSYGVVSSGPDVKGEQEIVNEVDRRTDQLGGTVEEKPQLSPITPVKKLVDPSAAAAARKRRKELTKLKYLHVKQIRL